MRFGVFALRSYRKQSIKPKMPQQGLLSYQGLQNLLANFLLTLMQ
jgi:hypothetical protein